MPQARLFTWWRLTLLLWIVIVDALWARSYYRADQLNYRTAGQTHYNLRLQSGVLAFEWIDESMGFRHANPTTKFWYMAPDGVCDTQTWGMMYSPTSRTELLGFIWITGSYTRHLGIPADGPYFFWAPARAIAIPFWFLLTVPSLLLLWLLLRAILRRRRQKPGHCPACGYDLRASSQRCPECGRTIDPDTIPQA